jgi:hypothetical protein
MFQLMGPEARFSLGFIGGPGQSLSTTLAGKSTK